MVVVGVVVVVGVGVGVAVAVVVGVGVCLVQVTPLPLISVRDVAEAVALPRSPGVHVSEIIGEIMKGVDPETYDTEYAKNDQHNWWEVGFMWEKIFSQVFAAGRTGAKPGSTLIRGWEIERDGIIGTPDWFEFDPDGSMWLSETKATWKSARGFDLYDKKFMAYLLQMRAYSYMLGGVDVVMGSRLYILHMNDDYERYVPAVRPYEVINTQRELDENWSGILNKGRKLGWLAA